jgi:hypothetical protein
LPVLLRAVLLIASSTATLYFIFRDGLLKLPWSWKSLVLDKAGGWQFMQQNGLCIAVYIAPDSFVSAYLTVLHMMPENYRWFKFWQHRYAL